MDRLLTIKSLLELIPDHKTELHIHHTAIPNQSYFTGQNHFTLQQNMRNAHINDNGWDDIGQHVTLMPDGVFVTGRDFDKAPVSSPNFNHDYAFMVETLGDFTKEKMTEPQKYALLSLAYWFTSKSKKYRLHNEMSERTVCPGFDRKWFESQYLTLNEMLAEKTFNPNEWTNALYSSVKHAELGDMGVRSILQFQPSLMKKFYYL